MDGSTLFDLIDHAPAGSDRPMIVDSFAGGGGASTGIEMALGRSPDIAINHNPAALALHEANHPDTLHLSENVYHVDPLDHLSGRHIGLMWFSPDCKHFSKAKGGKPVARNIRDLAWIVPGWIERIQKSGGRVDVVMMENVEEFAGWGPLVETDKGLMPCPVRKGQTFDKWCKALRRLGGKIERRELRACDYGAPTIRKRLFVIIRFDGRPIVWPEPTHGDPASDAVQSGQLKPWRTAAECIDWSLPCPSIFDTTTEILEKHGLRAKRPLAANTLARVARGMKRYVLDAADPFLVNATAPSITRFNSGATGSAMADPMPTVTANSYIKRPGGAAPLGLLTPFMATMRNSQKPWQGMTEPTHTITAGGAGISLVAPYLATYYGHGGPRGKRAADLTEPLRTVTVENRHALISPVLTYAQQGGGNRPVTDPHHTICASRKDQNMVIVPALVQTGYGERAGQAPRALDIGQPLGTVVAGGVKHAACAAFLAQQNGGPRMDAHAGHDARDPMSTIASSGSHQTPVAAFIARQFGASTGHAADAPLGTITAAGQGKSQSVAAFFAKYYGTGDGATMQEPLHTVTVQDRFGHVEAALAAPEFAPEHHDRARAVAEFLRAHDAWSGGEFATITRDGETFVIIDIGLRMLIPRELFNAQGFPPDYVIDGVWHQDGNDWTFEAFTKDVQVSCCGNSVSPPVAEALARANCAHLSEIAAAQAA